MNAPGCKVFALSCCHGITVIGWSTHTEVLQQDCCGPSESCRTSGRVIFLLGRLCRDLAPFKPWFVNKEIRSNTCILSPCRTVSCKIIAVTAVGLISVRKVYKPCVECCSKCHFLISTSLFLWSFEGLQLQFCAVPHPSVG